MNRTATILITWILLESYAHADYTLVSNTKGSFILFDEHNKALLTLGTVAFKKKWRWTGIEKQEQKKTDVSTTYSYLLDKRRIAWDLSMQTQEKVINLTSTIRSTTPIPLTYIALTLAPDEALKGGSVIIIDTKGKKTRLTIPLKVRQSKKIAQINYLDASNKIKLSVNFSQPVDIHHDQYSRIKLATDIISQETPSFNEISIKFPQKIHFYHSLAELPKQVDHSTWFPFKTKALTRVSLISMQDWLTTPTSPLLTKKGSVLRDGNKKKIWGTNVTYFYVAPEKKNALERTHFFTQLGINSVRMHKLTNPSWEGLGTYKKASEYDKEKMKKFDYWLNTLKESGISYGFSPIWDLMVFEGDKNQLTAYDEIIKANPKKPVTTGLVWFAKDIQDLHIETLTNLLNHKNPYSGLTYANDPALDYIEIQNEENIFFYTFFTAVKKHPTYHKLLNKQFSDWLIKKYKTHSRLVNTWGASSIDAFKKHGALPNEELSKRNINPFLNPWFYDNKATTGYLSKRLQDTAQFLFEKQQNYYHRASKAIRRTGYKGLIVTSNWQAGDKGAHFLNLLGDSTLGIVDRHNYQGGAMGRPGHTAKSGFKLNNTTMLDDPGSAMLSIGMQQVFQRPFMASEWLAVVPSEWAAADTTILAAYGFGLQGWDMSYHFTSDGNNFSNTLDFSSNKYNNRTPVGLGLYPVLSRMVLRGDITEAKPIAIRRLNKEQAIKNSYDFKNTLQQTNDVKSFTGTPHHNALAAGKVLIEFTKEKSSSTIKPWRQKYERANPDGSHTIRSSTNQLAWTYSKNKKDGFIEINSQGTQGIVGFTKDKSYTFNDINIQSHSPYSVILATAKSPTGTLQSDKEVIILAIARAHNTDMNFFGSLIADMGKAPIILEPVKATLQFKRKGVVKVLDHNGVATGKTYPLDSSGVFKLNTERDKTIYYLVSFES